ncbi:hypothetical protein [Alicyclobacillus sp. ALC3]|uniref:hypothetical protein n=1 Tax=Alicyclobacillus sp. ALC3 TaxID=2796143 RepID=UPI00237939AF|nr:hypothetical protein [Alicyclobacillus sp. ALC3]WDL95394.1 hypothetical protein JC200_13340 [Alicyclobacillus sp. ALC3]
MALFTAFAPIWRYQQRDPARFAPYWRYSPPLRQFGAIRNMIPLALRQNGAIHRLCANLALSTARQHPHAAILALFTVFAPIWRYQQHDPARFAPEWRYSPLLRQFGAISNVIPLALRQIGAIHRFCANLALFTAFAPIWRYPQRDPARFAPNWRYSPSLRQFGAIRNVIPLALRQNGAIHRFCANLALSAT